MSNARFDDQCNGPHPFMLEVEWCEYCNNI